MKILFIFLFIFFCGSVFAQDTGNRFQQAEQQAQPKDDVTATADLAKDPEVANAPGNPGELPIDDYIPFLTLSAIGIIVYSTYRKKTTF